jgi:TolB-like protein/Flp pilus assembly protein TadD
MESMNRQLTAIMFADMVGYTALMQEDEDQAKTNRDRNREALVRRVGEHNGKILQFYGDGALSVFQSAIQAVEAAIAVQGDLRTPPPVPVRIGLHTGDIIHDDEGVFGDGVNLASRVQSLAVPGGILISEKVYDEVKNQRGIETRSLGSFALKNVKRPMEIWAITNQGLAVPDPTEMGSRPSQCRNSVAVLPFLNMSSDPENEFFSDGVTEEIINALTRINGLQVTARTSSFAFKGKNQDVRTIGEELGVATVLEGSVRRSGNRVRITAQLINARDGYHLFSKSYDRELLNIFETQDELAETIAAELQDRFQTESPGEESSGPAKQKKPHRHFHDTQAYTEYLKGIHSFSQWTPEGARAAIRHFERSMEMDPECALPYSGMATAYTFLAALGQMPGSIAYPRAREAAEKAMALEEGTGESHAAMASILFFHDWDFDGAYRHFQKALTLTPGAAPLRKLYAMYLMAMGDLEAAEEELQWAIQMDPLSSSIRTALGETLIHSRRFGEAEAQLRQVLELDPDFRSAREALGWSFIAGGRFEEALRELEEIPRKTADPFKVIPHRMWALAGLGRMEETHQLFRLLEERREREPEISLEVDFAIAHLALGDPERSLDYLEEAVERRLGMVVFLNSALLWAELRSIPRFQKLVRRVGIPRATRES